MFPLQYVCNLITLIFVYIYNQIHYLKYLGVDCRIILKCTSNNRIRRG